MARYQPQPSIVTLIHPSCILLGVGGGVGWGGGGGGGGVGGGGVQLAVSEINAT